MAYFLIALIAFIIGGIATHFYWAPFHKAEMDGKDVIIDEAKQAKAWAEQKLAQFKAKIKS